ncbi:group I truncated hemoglobin [Anaeromyxobacter dehalogenans]|uniref:Globin like protein n=1 Tax=Anaeromyxobacter dehalogenans (strain 2CP-C) TaxID=290397 RepID=Q2IIP3_ANADE|nr:group 1 truncated hemoglobin [Anaeromyxobacter dehalogenans]ABC81527.1 Globin like protein [Anaeromyxobacter dehalogenans 2CP-C]
MAASLYERLGGEEKIAQIVNDVLDLHLKNPIIGTRFRLALARGAQAFGGDEAAAAARLKRVTVEFFASGSGGPQAYTGRDLREVHTGMNVNEQELVAAIDDIVLALERNGIGAPERNEVVAILYSLKGEVLRI